MSGSPVTFNGEERYTTDRLSRLVFNDTLSFFYLFGQGPDPLKKKSRFGDPLVHHGTYYRKNSPVIWFGSSLNRKDRFLLEDSLIVPVFDTVAETRQILGFTCYPALQVTPQNDSILVWYTPEIPVPYGPMAYVGFPGLVLEVINQRYGTHIRAERMQEGNIVPVIPDVERRPRSRWGKGK